MEDIWAVQEVADTAEEEDKFAQVKCMRRHVIKPISKSLAFKALGKNIVKNLTRKAKKQYH